MANKIGLNQDFVNILLFITVAKGVIIKYFPLHIGIT